MLVAGISFEPDRGYADLGLFHVGFCEAGCVEHCLGGALGFGLGDFGGDFVEGVIAALGGCGEVSIV